VIDCVSLVAGGFSVIPKHGTRFESSNLNNKFKTIFWKQKNQIVKKIYTKLIK